MEEYIELLKSKILDLAVKGKLVEQDKNDEPASILIDKIVNEKHEMMRKGEIKKEVLSSIYKDVNNHYYEKFEDGTIKDITEEIPFDIPDTWSWSRLSNIGLYKKGPFGSSLTKSIFVEKSNNAIKVYEQKNAIQKDNHLGEYYISKEYYENKMKSFEVFPGDIIVSCAGTIGETYIMPEKIEKGIINQALMKIRISKFLDIQYFLIYFDYILKRQSKDKSKGSAMKNMPPFDVFKKFLIPIPPRNEQAKINMEIKKCEEKIETIKIKYNNILLSQDLLKEKILDLAIRGKLVKQDKNDKTVDIFIDQMMKEKYQMMKDKKIKKENLSVIYKDDKDDQFYEKFDNGSVININDEIPFEIPNNWKWTRLRNISSIISKGTTPRGGKSIYIDKGIKFVRAENVKENKVVLDHIMYIDEETHKKQLKRSILEEYDILICIAGTLGRSGIITKDDLPANTNQAVSFIRLLKKDFYLANYVQKVISSNIIQSTLLDKTKVTAIPNLTLEIISNCLIPIPPLKEQKRIVEKSTKLLDNIKTVS